MAANETKLRRVISLPLLTFYGLGNILGAGIYVLIGKIIGYSGYHTPIAFLIASLVAGLTAFSFAELSSRYPSSAGPAVYVQRGLNLDKLSILVGFIIILTAIVSASTIARGFIGYLNVFISVESWVAIIILVSCLAGLAMWGISESVIAAALFTIIEISGLLLIIFVAVPSFDNVVSNLDNFIPSMDWDVGNGIFLGAFLAFYAYVGFEDIVHVAEEVKQPERTLPWGIIFSLLISTIFYIVIAVTVLSIATPEELSQSEAPLAYVYTQSTGNSPLLISAISLFAIVNGALIQIIMASRVCYGMSGQGWLPKFLGVIAQKTRTPVNATITISLIIIVMALWLPIESLARLTSYFLLFVFSLVNLSLMFIKMKKANIADAKIFEIPFFIPILGLVGCIALLALQTANLFKTYL